MQLKLRSIFFLLAICFFLFVWRLGDIPFYDRGEPREGLVVWEMYSSGNWILPRVNGDYIPFKPPLFHWIGLLPSKAVGRVDEFTVRFPSALFGTLGVLLTYLAGAFFWGETVGVISGLVLATTTGWWRAATIAQVDMTLAFFMVAAFLLFFFLYRHGRVSINGALGLSALLALATLAKGPAGIIVPGLAFFLFLWFQRDLAFLKRLHPLASGVLFLLVGGSWYAAAMWEGGKSFFLRQIVDENLLTATGTYGHPQPFYYFIPVFFLNMIPWSFFLPSTALFLYRQRGRLRERGFLYPIIWFVTVFVFFSVSFGKRGVYILPLYPAAALLLGAWWVELGRGEVKSLWVTCSVGYFVAISYLLVIAAYILHWRWGIFQSANLSDNFSLILRAIIPPSPMVFVCIGLTGTVALLLIWALRGKRWNWVFACFTISAVSAALVTKTVYYPSIAKEKTLKPFMERVKKEVDAKAPLLFYRSFDYGATFYAGRHIASYEERSQDLKPPFYLLMWEEEWKRSRGSKGLEVLDITEGRGSTDRHRLVLVRAMEYLSLP